ncbi:sodium ion-translocating decarboxylase subunit beta [Hominenteromicrobium sp.]|uniref:sodium ion-translocating decarboxylase subunit beta n=1 Tax=Hominenteromicrobium sp. TaxID=3073581 RepID=UPI003A934156
MNFLSELFANVGNVTWQHAVMWCIGGVLIYLAIAKKMEPALLLPIGFGTILVNLPLSGAVTQGEEVGVLTLLFDSGIANELFPLLLFIGIGAMIDFEPLLSNPKLFLFGAAAQFGIFFTLSMARLFNFDLHDAASIAIIGAADGPTSIFVANVLNSQYIGAITVAAYSYMALVPIVQPPVIRLLTTKTERRIRMAYTPGSVSKTTKILFPVLITAVVGIVSNRSAALIGFLMFGNLLRECGVLNSLSDAAQNVLSNLITLILGITITAHMTAAEFLRVDTLLILGLGLIAFVFDTVGGVLFAKIMNLFVKNKVNPMIGAAGISAFPMSARVIQKMAKEEDPYNFILMQSISANVSGQLGSIVAGGMVITLVGMMLGNVW